MSLDRRAVLRRHGIAALVFLTVAVVLLVVPALRGAGALPDLLRGLVAIAVRVGWWALAISTLFCVLLRRASPLTIVLVALIGLSLYLGLAERLAPSPRLLAPDQERAFGVGVLSFVAQWLTVRWLARREAGGR